MTLAATSLEAHETIKPFKTSIKQKVFDFIYDRGARGTTTDEVEYHLEILVQTATPRMNELEHEGYIRKQIDRTTGDYVRRPTRTGRSAFVYEPVPGAFYA